jgi:hypothetical protein
MAYTFPEGTKVFYSNTLAAAKNITGLTNAAPAVATSTAHGYIDLDPILLSSGWEEATETVYEVDQLTVDTFGITGLDATNTNLFASGTGTGTAKRISNWVEMQQVLNVSASGGTPKYGTVSPLASRMDKKFVIGYDAAALDVKVGYDASNVQQQAMQSLARTYAKVAIKLVLPGGGRIYGYGNLTASEFPEITRGQALQISVGVGFDGRAISYGA